MKSPSKQVLAIEATCPACGLACDDVAPQKTSCAKAAAFFSQPLAQTQPSLHGRAVSLPEAVQAAAKLINKAKKPVIAGLSTDVTGFRAVYNLAEKTQAKLLHANAASIGRNMQVLQSTGWQTTTLTELKNRADVVVCIGTDIVSHNPRFFERFVWTKEAMFTDSAAREIVYIGHKKLNTVPGISPQNKAPSHLPCAQEKLPEVIAALHALVLGKPVKAAKIAGVALKDLQALAEKLKAAKYAVLCWIAKDLDFAHAELSIQQITQTVAALNQTTRAMGLPLGGSDGDTSVNYAHTWLNGKVLSELPNVKPDLQIWVNSFNADAAPGFCQMPTIVLGNANTPWRDHADVFIPVATPGLDCGGTLFRVDGSVALPLKPIRQNNLPTLQAVLAQIAEHLK